MDERPAHLRPVPAPSSEATARELDEVPADGTAGLTKPLGRGNSAMFLTDVVVELGYATRERVEAVIEEARIAGRSADEMLIEQRLIDADQLSRAVAERYGLDHVDLSAYHVDMGAANLLSVASARRYQAVPVGYVDKNTLLVAIVDPANVLAIDDIQMITGLQLPDGGRGGRRRRRADQAPQLARDGGHRGRRRRGRGGGRARPRSRSCASPPTTRR